MPGSEHPLGVGDDPRDPLEAPSHGRESDVERRELAGRQRKEAHAQEVDPRQRIPRQLVQLCLAEPQGGQLAQDQVAVDSLVGGEIGHIESAERTRPAVRERDPHLAARLRRVGPSVVVAVIADGGGNVGPKDEQLFEERLDEVGEHGHGGVSRMVWVGPSLSPHRPRVPA